MFDLPHVASRLYGTPLLVSRPHLESVLSLVENRMFHGEPLASAEGRDSRSADLRITSASFLSLGRWFDVPRG